MIEKNEGTKLDVALLAEGADRNCSRIATGDYDAVALLAEDVGRNNKTEAATSVSAPVALLTEGVDRNLEADAVHIVRRCRPPHGGRG